VKDRGAWRVFYSGYSAATEASTMLAATIDGAQMRKASGVVFADDRFKNPKEPAVVAKPDGFRLFFEYAIDGASRIGVADAASLDGPWTFGTPPLLPRGDRFDAFHLSPICGVRMADGRVLLFYNGSKQEVAWRIGWALFATDGVELIERCDEPLVAPGPVHGSDTDIAFGASVVVVERDHALLYHSLSDRYLRRIAVRIDGAIGDAAEPTASR